jgi:hypothetical protein
MFDMKVSGVDVTNRVLPQMTRVSWLRCVEALQSAT